MIQKSLRLRQIKSRAWWSIISSHFFHHECCRSWHVPSAFFSHQASVKEAAGECLFSSASSGCFHLPSKLMKIFTPENQEDNFPSLTVFQRHLDCVKSFCVRWEQIEREDATCGMSAPFNSWTLNDPSRHRECFVCVTFPRNRVYNYFKAARCS